MAADVKTPKAVVYLRISQDRDGDGLAIDRQRGDCYRLAELHGWTVVHEYADTVSAYDKRKARPDYDAMVAAYRRGAFDVLICWDLDRLTRQPRQLEDWIEHAEEHGLRIVTANGEADLGTDNGRLFARIKASVARAEVDRKGARQRSRHQQTAMAGKPPMRRAFGYHKDGSLHLNEAPAVEEVFSRFLAGGSITAIARWLNDAGHTTTTGRRWDRAGVRKMLRNVRYAGIRVYDGDEIGPGNWPAIVAEDTVRATTDMLKDPVRHATLKGTARRWLGSRLFLCGRCAERRAVATVAVQYDHGRYRQYRCQTCWMVRRADPIDDLVSRFVAELLRARAPHLLAEKAPDVSPLRTEAAALRQRIDTLAADITLSEAVLSRRVSALEDRLAEVEVALTEAGRTSALASVLGAPDPGTAWLELDDVAARQAVVRELATVTLLPAKGGRRGFDPDTVAIVPRET